MYRTSCILICLGLAASWPACSQELAPTDSAVAPAPEQPTSLSAAEIANRADEVSAALLTMQDNLQAGLTDITGIPEEIDGLETDLDDLLQILVADEVSELRLADIETLLQTLTRMEGQLDAWRKKLQQRSDELDQYNRTIKVQLEFFQAVPTDDDDDYPQALIERIDLAIDQLNKVRPSIRESLDKTLAELTRLSAIKLRIREASQLISLNQSERERAVLSFNGAPIWQLERPNEPLRTRVTHELGSRFDSLTEYARANESAVAASVVTLVLTLALVLYGRRRAIGRTGEHTDAYSQRILIERPVALAALLWVLVVVQIMLPPVPTAAMVGRVLIVIVALLRVLPILYPDIERRSLTALLCMTAVSSVLVLMQLSDLYDRLLLLSLSAAGIYLFAAFGRVLARMPDTERDLWWKLGRFLTTVSPVALGVSIVATLIGATAFAEQTVVGAYFLITLLFAMAIVENALQMGVQFFIQGPGQRSLRSIRRYPDLVRNRLTGLTRILMVLIPLSMLPRLFPLVGLFYEWSLSLLTTERSIGTVQVSAADVLVLLGGLVLAVYVSRLIRFTLDEDVFPRLPIAAGAASAASRLIYYTLVTGSIVFVLAATGVELTKLTLVISALGVGIGFGLQGIVNNFVSGLVLAFEQPFQVGDIIAVGTLTGRVRQIGLRASRVRTFDGAEVIVPNADLIAGHVINWTLSDRMRRLDIDVGVAYGSDVATVRDILLKVSADAEAISREPGPVALFRGFGESSLDFTLRVWIPEAGDWPQISSGIYEATYAALGAAGIEIPFPQRTLHIQREDCPEPKP